MSNDVDPQFQVRDGTFLNRLLLGTEIGFMAVDERISVVSQRLADDPVKYRLHRFDLMVGILRAQFERELRKKHNEAVIDAAVTTILRSVPKSPER